MVGYMLMEKVCKHAKLTERILQITNFNEIEGSLEDLGNIAETETQADLFLVESNDESSIEPKKIFVRWGKHGSQKPANARKRKRRNAKNHLSPRSRK